MSGVKVYYYSDVLCIWAYVAQRRLEQLAQDFGDQIDIEPHFVSVFPDTRTKIETNWRAKGGFAGFNKHLQEVAKGFDHIRVHEDIWLNARPRTSASAHLFLKAIELIEETQADGDVSVLPFLDRLSTRAAAAVRHAFFTQGLDISERQVLADIATELGVDATLLNDTLQSAQAMTSLAADYDLSQKNDVTGSPTFIMNNGRQRLFGNVGYRLLEANVHELLSGTASHDASWC